MHASRFWAVIFLISFSLKSYADCEELFKRFHNSQMYGTCLGIANEFKSDFLDTYLKTHFLPKKVLDSISQPSSPLRKMVNSAKYNNCQYYLNNKNREGLYYETCEAIRRGLNKEDCYKTTKNIGCTYCIVIKMTQFLNLNDIKDNSKGQLECSKILEQTKDYDLFTLCHAISSTNTSINSNTITSGSSISTSSVNDNKNESCEKKDAKLNVLGLGSLEKIVHEENARNQALAAKENLSLDLDKQLKECKLSVSGDLNDDLKTIANKPKVLANIIGDPSIAGSLLEGVTLADRLVLNQYYIDLINRAQNIEPLKGMFKDRTAKKFVKELKTALDIDSKSSPLNYGDIVKTNVDDLKNGEAVVISLGWEKHATLIRIKKNLNDDNYTLKVINTGDGLEFHKLTLDSKNRGEVVLEYNSVTKKQLSKRLFSDLRAIYNGTAKDVGSEQFYSILSTHLKPLTPTKRDIYFKKTQYSGTCGARAVDALYFDLCLEENKEDVPNAHRDYERAKYALRGLALMDSTNLLKYRNTPNNTKTNKDTNTDTNTSTPKVFATAEIFEQFKNLTANGLKDYSQKIIKYTEQNTFDNPYEDEWGLNLVRNCRQDMAIANLAPLDPATEMTDEKQNNLDSKQLHFLTNIELYNSVRTPTTANNFPDPISKQDVLSEVELLKNASNYNGFSDSVTSIYSKYWPSFDSPFWSEFNPEESLKIINGISQSLKAIWDHDQRINRPNIFFPYYDRMTLMTPAETLKAINEYLIALKLMENINPELAQSPIRFDGILSALNDLVYVPASLEDKLLTNKILDYINTRNTRFSGKFLFEPALRTITDVKEFRYTPENGKAPKDYKFLEDLTQNYQVQKSFYNSIRGQMEEKNAPWYELYNVYGNLGRLFRIKNSEKEQEFKNKLLSYLNIYKMSAGFNAIFGAGQLYSYSHIGNEFREYNDNYSIINGRDGYENQYDIKGITQRHTFHGFKNRKFIGLINDKTECSICGQNENKTIAQNNTYRNNEESRDPTKEEVIKNLRLIYRSQDGVNGQLKIPIMAN